MIAATILMAVAAILAEALHRRVRRGDPASRIAGVTALRVALVGFGMAMPALLMALLKAAGL
ncbi:hypothetical protein MKK75_03070 [Methylobacterium sp. J-030]|uniref:hypothetical protein n=1 Tax=Methylobacterium sp. J-030 TaxID=2836627 RepID=UPI001FB9254A|nr:hypothetical protein [Methylobacterium sp. J-030]MCJ2067797.1 hypothetical protein [Methylobacterium sp. J-030]